MRLSGEFVFINAVRLRLDLDNYASFSHLLTVFGSSGIGSLHLHRAPTLKEWQRFLALLLVPSGDLPEARFDQITAKLVQQDLTVFEVGEPMAQRATPLDQEQSKEVAKKTYAQSV